MEYSIETATGELYHHGIKGQKWGVRRYQNYDGSYTRAGMKRYNESLDAFNKTDNRYKQAKASYKISKDNGAKTELTNARLARKKAKAKLDKDYKHLKLDKLGDQGKELYSKGKTISSSAQVRNVMTSAAAISLSAVSYNAKTNNQLSTLLAKTLRVSDVNAFNRTFNTVVSAAGIGLGTAAAAKTIADNYSDKRLRAYYNHTSNY